MTTTIMRDSIVGDAWIQQSMASVPIQRVIDPETGQPTGDLLTGPVRLSFPDLFTLPKATEDNDNPKFGSILIFPPNTDFSIMYEEFNRVAAAEFASHFDAGTQQYLGLRSPFRDQADKAKFGGFTPGSTMITSSSQFKPPVVDIRCNPIVDPSKVYAGVWAICTVNAYAYKPNTNKGIAFGLQSVMIIGDDSSLGGGGADAQKNFQGVKGAIVAPAATAPAAGAMFAGGQPPAGTPAGAVTPPPAGGTYAAPATAVAGLVADPRGAVPAGFASWIEYDELMG